MDEIVIGIKVKKTNLRARTISKEDGGLQMDVEKIVIDFFNGQYKYHFNQSQGFLDVKSLYDVEVTINLNGNRFVESHAFDIKDRAEQDLKKHVNVRVVDKKGAITTV